MVTESLIRENWFGKISENANPRKLCTSKIWHYTVYYIIYIYTEKGAFISLKELALFAIKTGIERNVPRAREWISLRICPPAAMPPWTKRVSPTTAAI